MIVQQCGVCIIIFDTTKKQILLGKRKNSYRAGQYGTPGGRLELGESLETCGKRELLEETGLRANELNYLGVVREFQDGTNFIHFIYTCMEYKGKPKVIEQKKCEKWEWYPLNSLPNNILTGHQAAITMYKNKSTIIDLYN